MVHDLASRSNTRAHTRRIARLFVIAAVALCFSAAGAVAQERPQPRRALPDGFPDLVGGLKAIKGCLGVETARTASGKNVIFAWFENKEAVLRWYYSDMHRGVMKSFVEGPTSQKPLHGVADNSGPIMVIASITFSDKPLYAGLSLPISQIAVELYAPVTGGIFLGSKFAPDSLVVPGIQDLTPGKD